MILKYKEYSANVVIGRTYDHAEIPDPFKLIALELSEHYNQFHVENVDGVPIIEGCGTDHLFDNWKRFIDYCLLTKSRVK